MIEHKQRFSAMFRCRAVALSQRTDAIRREKVNPESRINSSVANHFRLSLPLPFSRSLSVSLSLSLSLTRSLSLFLPVSHSISPLHSYLILQHVDEYIDE